MADSQQEAVAPALDNGTEGQSAVIDTQVETATTSQPSSEAHEETKTTSPEVTTQPKAEEEKKPEAHVETEEEKRFRIKMSKLEKENAEWSKRFKTVEEALTKRPDTYKELLMETSGYSEEEAENIVKELRKAGISTTQPVQPSQATPVASQDVAGLVRQAYEAEKQAEFAKAEARSFISKHPEMEPSNLKDYEKPIMQKIAEGIDYRASQIIEEAQLDGKTLARNDAREQAYAEFKGLTSREVAKAREQGEIEGMAKSNAINSAVTRTDSVSGQVTKSNVSLTDAERAIAKAANMTEDEYFEWKDKEAVIS